MKKLIIAYGVIAIALGVTLLAFGIYLVRLNLAEMLAESMKDLGIVAVIFFILLSIPILLARIIFWVCIFYGVAYTAAGIIAIFSYSKGNLIHLKKNLLAFIIVNSLILFLIAIVDLFIIYLAINDNFSGASPLFIVFITLTTALTVAFEVIAVKARKKLKQTLMNEGQPL